MGVDLADLDAPPPPWTIVQGWTKGNQSGHTFLILGYDTGTDRVLTLESKRPEVPTWDDLRATYVSRDLAVLKVTDIGWVRGS